ncbi:chromate transporter [Clostridium sulfidigenes]|uniref:chromate transporter n=1 Tax=Clostridium sulfidigenes TaxID=318464 RepID=UPI003F892EDA
MYNSIFKLFLSFLQIGFFSIGGGYATIPLIQEQVVEKHAWLTMQKFTDIITISQMTPGPLAVNTSTFVGIQISGISGAIVATLGCIISGFFISLFLYKFFQSHDESKNISNILKGLRSASIGLIASSAGTILMLSFLGTSTWKLVEMSLQIKPIIIFVVCLFLLRKTKVNPMEAMILSGIAGILF